MREIKILIVDDEKLIRWSLEKELTKSGYRVFTAEDGKIGWTIFCEERPAVIFLDYKLPGLSGIELLQKIRERDQNCPVIMITAHGGIETAVAAMKAGAFDYITKPFNIEEINLLVHKALEVYFLREKIESQIAEKREKWGIESIIGNSKATLELKEKIKKIATSQSSTILIQGESGTGKELVARAIHFESNRASEPFVAVNCSAIPDTIFESELFGHEKGAFTDAINKHQGYFELADGGTIFLDEISEMNYNMQAKFLRVIEEKSVRRVGGNENISVDVRIVAATNQDLETLVNQGKFREDLYYRLNVVTVSLPPLRRRETDVILLADYFLKKYNQEFKKEFSYIDEKAKEILLQHNWPGNVRELKNLIERIVLMNQGNTIRPEHLHEINQSYRNNNNGFLKNIEIPESGIDLEEIELTLIKKALEAAGNNQTKAAKLLNISRDTLRYRMKKFNLNS